MRYVGLLELFLSITILAFAESQDLASQLKAWVTGPPLRVATEGLDSQGISIATVASPNFAQLLLPLLKGPITPELINFLPYSAIITNGTNREVAFFTVIWKFTDKAGKQITHTVTESSLQTPVSGEAIPPHSAKLVSMQARLGAARGPDATTIARRWVTLAPIYKRQVSVVVLLDAVVFRDGQIVGPDVSGTAALEQAKANVYVNLLTDLVENSGIAPDHLREHLLSFRTDAIQFLGPRSGEVRKEVYLHAARGVRDPDELVTLMRAYYATDLLDRADHIGGINALPAFAQRALLRSKRPAPHR
jgi:hypothetical protein